MKRIELNASPGPFMWRERLEPNYIICRHKWHTHTHTIGSMQSETRNRDDFVETKWALTKVKLNQRTMAFSSEANHLGAYLYWKQLCFRSKMTPIVLGSIENEMPNVTWNCSILYWVCIALAQQEKKTPTHIICKSLLLRRFTAITRREWAGVWWWRWWKAKLKRNNSTLYCVLCFSWMCSWLRLETLFLLPFATFFSLAFVA